MPDKSLYSLAEALTGFVVASRTQDRLHIDPLHWYIASALVVEGGFRPEHITPRPPFRVESQNRGRARQNLLIYDEEVARKGERTVLGGLKTKSIDIVVSTSHVGPCLAVSVKGSINAFRNLTNRMEEAVGDCTNLHISYPTLVYGFIHIIRATPELEARSPRDVAIRQDGSVVEDIVRYRDALARLTGRVDVRNEISRYEAIALVLVDTTAGARGTVRPDFPIPETDLRLEIFFSTLYRTYDLLRFVYSAPRLRRATKRLEWSTDSPAFQHPELAAFVPRLAALR